MYIKLKAPAAPLTTCEPLPAHLPTWRLIPQPIRFSARLARVYKRVIRRARAQLGLDWPLGIERAAEALHAKFQAASQDKLRAGAQEKQGGAR